MSSVRPDNICWIFFNICNSKLFIPPWVGVFRYFERRSVFFSFCFSTWNWQWFQVIRAHVRLFVNSCSWRFPKSLNYDTNEHIAALDSTNQFMNSLGDDTLGFRNGLFGPGQSNDVRVALEQNRAARLLLDLSHVRALSTNQEAVQVLPHFDVLSGLTDFMRFLIQSFYDLKSYNYNNSVCENSIIKCVVSRCCKIAPCRHLFVLREW